MNQKEIALLIVGGVLATTAFFSITPAFYSNLNDGSTTELPGEWYAPKDAPKGGKTRSKKQNRTRRK
jgi:hypothetical protein